jgi:hypothetical protein
MPQPIDFPFKKWCHATNEKTASWSERASLFDFIFHLGVAGNPRGHMAQRHRSKKGQGFFFLLFLILRSHTRAYHRPLPPNTSTPRWHPLPKMDGWMDRHAPLLGISMAFVVDSSVNRIIAQV